MHDQVLRLPENRFGQFLKGKDRYEGFGETHNWRKRTIFWELPYWPDLAIRHVLDVMHVEKNVFDNIFYTSIGGKDKRNKDDVKARKDLESICMRPSLHIREQGHRVFKPKASYALAPAEVRMVCQWLKKVKFIWRF